MGLCVYLHRGDETLSGGAEGRGHGEFRRQWELRGQTEKRRASALKTLQVTQIQEGKAAAVAVKYRSLPLQSHKSTPALQSKHFESQ